MFSLVEAKSAFVLPINPSYDGLNVNLLFIGILKPVRIHSAFTKRHGASKYLALKHPGDGFSNHQPPLSV